MNKDCQVFTPQANVTTLLDSIGYTSNLYGKTIIENSCGDGNILKEIVYRYILDALDKDMDKPKIIQGLQTDIYGIEIDYAHYINCIEALNNIVASFGIENIKWNIFNIDFFEYSTDCKFDYVVGNPPYIAYRNLDIKRRNHLKHHFSSCKNGQFDYCYAFIESSISLLNTNGKMAYLVPNNIFKNVFAENLRRIILPHLSEIIDYTITKLFINRLTSSCILICHKDTPQLNITYYDVSNTTTHIIPKYSLSNKWIFNNTQNYNSGTRLFKDYFTASMSVATLLNEAYVLKEFIEDENYVIVGDFKIERELVKPAVSPRSLRYNKTELIIFPYRYIGTKLERYDEKFFHLQYPEATKYLKQYSQRLSLRNSDTSSKWFEYGRSQALLHLNTNKLLISHIVTQKVKVYELSEDFIPYSGIYILPKKDLPLSTAKKVLESAEFYQYIQGIGTNVSGSSLSITSSDINNFKF